MYCTGSGAPLRKKFLGNVKGLKRPLSLPAAAGEDFPSYSGNRRLGDVGETCFGTSLRTLGF